MFLNVMCEGHLSKISFKTNISARDLLEQLSKEYNTSVSRLAVFINRKEISKKSDLSLFNLEESTIRVIKKSFFFIHVNGLCISALFPLSYKVSVFLNCFIPIFKERGIELTPNNVSVHFQKSILDRNRTLQSYGVCENDTIVLVDNDPPKAPLPSEWEMIICSLQDQIIKLESAIEEKDICIAALTERLANAFFSVCYHVSSIISMSN